MLRKLATVLTVFLMIGVMAAAPAVAAEDPAGDQIVMFDPSPMTFPADTPFHVMHGFGLEVNLINAVGQVDFRLDIDGVDQGKGSLLNFGNAGPNFVVKLWLYNFEDGMSEGSYVFTGHWMYPCTNAVEEGLVPGPCDKPNAPVEIFTAGRTVTFTP